MTSSSCSNRHSTMHCRPGKGQVAAVVLLPFSRIGQGEGELVIARERQSDDRQGWEKPYLFIESGRCKD